MSGRDGNGRITLAAGDRAPAFTVETTEGRRTLDALLADGALVLVFYAEDLTPTCTTQLCSFRDEHATLRDLGANVLGVSADSLESHRRFVERLGGLPFPIAADPALELATAYGVVDEENKRSYRAVFVISADAVVLEANPRYQPAVMDQFAAVFRALGLSV